MNMHFPFAGLKKRQMKSVSNAEKKKVERILHLREQLIFTGYNPGEVDYMIDMISTDQSIYQMESAMIKTVEETLEKQLSIARQCIEFTRSAK
ncbi:MAG: hypothetical protein U9N81_01360 [Bacillota bacterium]|nr:hypothetical protein [Bacillota bacterium]